MSSIYIPYAINILSWPYMWISNCYISFELYSSEWVCIYVDNHYFYRVLLFVYHFALLYTQGDTKFTEPLYSYLFGSKYFIISIYPWMLLYMYVHMSHIHVFGHTCFIFIIYPSKSLDMYTHLSYIYVFGHKYLFSSYIHECHCICMRICHIFMYLAIDICLFIIYLWMSLHIYVHLVLYMCLIIMS